MKSANSTSDGRDAITANAATQARIAHSGTRFFQLKSLKL